MFQINMALPQKSGLLDELIFTFQKQTMIDPTHKVGFFNFPPQYSFSLSFRSYIFDYKENFGGEQGKSTNHADSLCSSYLCRDYRFIR